MARAGLLARVRKLERQDTVDTGKGLSGLLQSHGYRHRDPDQERADQELLERCLAGKATLVGTVGLHRLMLEHRLQRMRAQLQEARGGYCMRASLTRRVARLEAAGKGSAVQRILLMTVDELASFAPVQVTDEEMQAFEQRLQQC
jgi:hypothetical protein